MKHPTMNTYTSIVLFPCRSASITNLSLDRSGSPMVPAYETSVSPQATRTHMKAETSEDERKILLVPSMLLLPCSVKTVMFAFLVSCSRSTLLPFKALL